MVPFQKEGEVTATIDTLPVWKQDSTPAEWLQELAACALARPHQWQKIVVAFQFVGDKIVETRSLSYNCPTNVEKIGILETAKCEVFEEMKGRR